MTAISGSRVLYRCDGKSHRYTPDVLVVWGSHHEVVEIKEEQEAELSESPDEIAGCNPSRRAQYRDEDFGPQLVEVHAGIADHESALIAGSSPAEAPGMEFVGAYRCKRLPSCRRVPGPESRRWRWNPRC